MSCFMGNRNQQYISLLYVGKEKTAVDKYSVIEWSNLLPDFISLDVNMIFLASTVAPC